MNSVSRSFQILELVADNQERGLSFPMIVQQLQCPNSSAFRLLKQLVALKYLTYDEVSRRYYVSFRLARLGACVTASHNLTRIGHIFLRRLFEESSHTCSMGVLEKDHGVYVDVFTSTKYGIKLLSAVGMEFPLHCTALGKVLLAYMDPGKRSFLLPERLPAFTEASITEKDRLERQLKEVLAQGYAIDKGEITRGITCIAAPIFDLNQEVIAAVSISCPDFAFDQEGEAERLKDLVTNCGQTLSEAFGYRSK